MKTQTLSPWLVSLSLATLAVLGQQLTHAPQPAPATATPTNSSPAAAPTNSAAGTAPSGSAPVVPAALGTNALSTNAVALAETAPSGSTPFVTGVTKLSTNAVASAETAPVGPATNGLAASLAGANRPALAEAPGTNAVAASTNAALASIPPVWVQLPNGQKGLRVNFRGVPLEMVLSYLSRAAGYIIMLETPVSGKVDVWSEQPLTIDEAVNLLDSVLNRNGYAAIHSADRILTIVSRSAAPHSAIPVVVAKPNEEIPKNDRMVTEIIPVRYANAVAMTRDLQPLLPEYATLTANESANSLVLTDIQSDIHRMVDIVRALDTSISGIASIKVFPLRFADAKDLASELKELFPAQNTTGRGGGPGFNPLAMMFGGRGGGFGGRGGGGGGVGGGGTGASEARAAASRVAAVADERTNSLVVSAPDDLMPTIEELVKQIDTNAENITELRVFKLTYADPVETADMLTSLFPDETRTGTTGNNRSQFQFGRGGFGGPFGPSGFGPGGGGQSGASDRARQKTRVLAVADARTSSVIVTAPNDLMPQIAEMIAQLDLNPARKQRVHVYTLTTADPDNALNILQDMFGSTLTRNTRNQNNNALQTRQQTAAQSIGTTIMQNTTTTGRNAFGSGSPF